MSNSYFQFKQFKIAQDRCAMKITTDACIQGAWTPILPHVKHVLDIGAGTGLLSLMLAQRDAHILIDAIENDDAASAQAAENAAQSPWHDRINIIAGDVRGYEATCKYDLIISNPPFFNSSLLGPDAKKNTARHTLSLTYTDLLKAIAANLAKHGYVSVLLPLAEYHQWKSIMKENDWNEAGKLDITHTAHAAIKRVISIWNKQHMLYAQEQRLTIKDQENNYSRAFSDLLSPFYLGL
jgi:tRNA1Val (adenine37-N6)-methyltransferase